MYRINKHFISGIEGYLLESGKGTVAFISTMLGGSLQQLQFDSTTMIPLAMEDYNQSYRGAILFPYANRVANGNYVFQGKKYQLPITEIKANNALHGLVFNKTFELRQKLVHQNKALLQLAYSFNGNETGFPWKFDMILQYTLQEHRLELEVKITNKDSSAFPFVLGWHPYFAVANLDNAVVRTETNADLHCDQKQIPTHCETMQRLAFSLEQEYDNGFVWSATNLRLHTEEYELEFVANQSQYLQLYSPPNRSELAIEPMTGAANAFQNQWGLKLLQPEEVFKEKWTIINHRK
ncbi:MAG: aldose 1-epimerase [Flavobacteriaceae bacterium]|nr:aldose 1-epimerase [Flavobacteriaceae bacterium]